MNRTILKIWRAVSRALLVGSIVTGLTIGAVLPLAEVFADESITVSCYNLEASELPVGNAVVFDTSTAAAVCNSMYYSCKGRCVGCFTDQDYVDAVCVDVSGTTFLK